MNMDTHERTHSAWSRLRLFSLRKKCFGLPFPPLRANRSLQNLKKNADSSSRLLVGMTASRAFPQTVVPQAIVLGLLVGLAAANVWPLFAVKVRAASIAANASTEQAAASQRVAQMERTVADWPDLAKYRAADAALPPPEASEKRVVFLGDSITEIWRSVDPEFFAEHPSYVDRGISGQTTPQMLIRFRQDVIALRPAVVVILAGTNDIAENTGPTTLGAIEDNLESMAELARASGIRVVLSSVLPVLDYPWHRGLHPAPKIAALNSWMKSYCAKEGCVYLDYFSAMADAKKGLPSALSADGVHPNQAGFAIMDPLAEKAIARALAHE